jgi:hypothetical protein
MSLLKLPLPKDAVALDAALRYLVAVGGRDFPLPADELKQFALLTLDKVMRMCHVDLAQDVWRRLEQGFPESKIILLANSEESRAFMVIRENSVNGHEEIFPVILAPVNKSPRNFLLTTFKRTVQLERLRPERKQAQIALAARQQQASKRRDGLGHDLDLYCDDCTERMENAANCLMDEVLIDMARSSPEMARKVRMSLDGMADVQIAKECNVRVQAVSQARRKFRDLLIKRRSALETVPTRPAISERRPVNRPLQRKPR